MCKDLTSSFCYTFLANLLQLPTAAVPTCRVQEDECFYHSEHSDMLSDRARQCMEGAAGLPMGVQVSAAPGEDEMCLGIASQLEQVQPGVGSPLTIPEETTKPDGTAE